MRSGRGWSRCCRRTRGRVAAGMTTAWWSTGSCSGAGRAARGVTCPRSTGTGRPSITGIVAGRGTGRGRRSWTACGPGATRRRGRRGRSRRMRQWSARIVVLVLFAASPVNRRVGALLRARRFKSSAGPQASPGMGQHGPNSDVAPSRGSLPARAHNDLSVTGRPPRRPSWQADISCRTLAELSPSVTKCQCPV